MRVRINQTSASKRLYIEKKVRKGKTVTTVNVEKLGSIESLKEKLNVETEEEVLAWAKKRAQELTREKEELKDIVIRLSQSERIKKEERRSFLAGYLFLQDIYYSLNTKNLFRNIKNRHKYEYDLDAITSDLIYARILEPGSKLASYETAKKFLEAPKYQLYDVYRALSILSKESDYIQSEIYRNSNLYLKRNNRILYYDCTNYYFEIEEEDDLRKYGKGKDHHPSPIVQMGLFMDGDGIPLAYSLFPGNQNEQPSLKPLEQKIIRNFGLEKFIVCTDGGLGSEDNRFFNDIQGRAFICTQSLKKLNKKDREEALSDSNWKRLSDRKAVDLSEIKKDPENYTHELYYKEDVYGSKKVKGQLMILTYSPKYALYQKKIRDGQIARAEKMVESNERKKQRNNPNDPARFVKVIATTEEGEAAEEKHYSLDQEKIDNESLYDGYYALCTDLVEEDVADILSVAEGRWEIEESFRIMKSEFKARPVYLSREDRINAHFLICFLSLLIYRILEKKLESSYTVEEITSALRSYTLLKINGEGYIPEYTRTALTDKLHDTFNFYTDTEIITARNMRKIIAQTKK